MTWSTEYSTPPLHDALPIYVNFDDPCAERRGGDAAVDAAGMIRDADPATVARAQLRHHAEAGALGRAWVLARALRSEEHTSELQSPCNIVCRLLLENKRR